MEQPPNNIKSVTSLNSFNASNNEILDNFTNPFLS